jgi:hypothetical protein
MIGARDWRYGARDDRVGLVSLYTARTPSRVLGVDPGLTRCGLASGGTPGADALLTAAFPATPFMLDDF